MCVGGVGGVCVKEREVCMCECLRGVGGLCMLGAGGRVHSHNRSWLLTQILNQGVKQATHEAHSEKGSSNFSFLFSKLRIPALLRHEG